MPYFLWQVKTSFAIMSIGFLLKAAQISWWEELGKKIAEWTLQALLFSLTAVMHNAEVSLVK